MLLGQGLEFRAEGVEQFVEDKRLRIGRDLAVLQARNIQQVADQVLGRTQRAIQVLDQLLGLRGQAVVLVGEGGGEQAGGVQWLHQVVADRREESGLGLVGRFRRALGLGQGDVQLRQFVGPFGDALFQALVGFGQGLLGLAERGDVGEAHDKTATGHRVADQLDHPAVGEQPLRGMRAALAHPVQAPRDMHFGLAGPAQAAFGVVADDIGNRPADADQAVRVIEQFQVTPVPGHQPQGLVDHADALGDVFDGALQQRAVELQDFGGFVGDPDDIFELHFPPFNGGFHHRAGRGRPEYPGQQALGVGDPVTVGVLVRVEALALAIGETDKTLARAFFADKACGEGQQVFDLYRQHRAGAGSGVEFLADKTPGLPVLGDPRARQHRDPGEQGEVARQ